MPTGQRSYLDTVERVFNFRIPGRKSEMFNLNLYNVNVTDPVLKSDLEAIIKDNIYDIVPAAAKLQDVKWDGKPLSASSLSAAAPTTNIHQPQFAEGVYLAGNYYYD